MKRKNKTKLSTEEKVERFEFISRYIKILVVWAAFLIIISIELPYYIDAPGGLTDISSRVMVEGTKESAGSINITYVTEHKGALFLVLFANFYDDWEVIPKGESNVGTLNYESMLARQKILMKESYTTAIKYAYEKAGKKITHLNEKVYVTYIFKEAETDLQVGDQLIELNNEKVTGSDALTNLINKYVPGTRVKIKVKDINGKEKIRYSVIKKNGKQVMVGIGVNVEYDIKTEPAFTLKYDQAEYGPSGGLMISLAVYNSLVDVDITGGKTIVGTGTLDKNGKVGLIGGIEYKIKGAVKKGADVFFVPAGENYEDALKLKKEMKFDMELVEVKTFEDALNYLMDNVVKK